MRFKSNSFNNYRIYAVSGTNSVSFAIDFTKANTKGLLGFSVKRSYPDGKEYYLPGFKVFKRKEKPDPKAVVSTKTDPVQSFVWDDFTLADNTVYTYTFFPVTGKPDKLIEGSPIKIKIKTEAAFSTAVHDVFFNRGVASSQAYAREFHNISPDKLVGKKQQDAFDWLARDLYKAIIKFIEQAKKGDTLLGAFYEFDYPSVLDAFKKAIDKGVNLTIIIDAKNNEHTVNGKFIPSSPRVANLAAIRIAKIPKANVIYREANKDMIHHNKFIVYQPKNAKNPIALWTGSTNITESGIFGQTNVGHWLRDQNTAISYKKYWEILSKDPGAKDNDSPANKITKIAAYKKSVVALQNDITGELKKGITPVFSPRETLKMLNKYFEQIDKATGSSVITLAFGITATLKTQLLLHTAQSPIGFMMLEKQDKATKNNKNTFVALSAKNNIYEAFGSYIADPLYNWTKETNSSIMGITTFVTYIHSKFLINDPLGDDPIVITGSANFSPPSTTGNDENMIIIRGNLKTADIYFTEFNRIFNHYYFRSIVQQLKDKKIKDDEKSYYLDNTDAWLTKYKPGALRRKRVDMFVQMSKPVTLS